ncbi:MAG: glycosyltransferase family 2 protein [Ignavibacteria bacterium]|nr:glycosyltransferase family 2 protein [Ignavibacteria bacterium]
MPKISVIIITWNALHFLEKCLTSLNEKNSSFEYELIIIDNKSSDGSIEYIEEKFPQAILIKNKTNKGVGPARNQGLQIAKGKYILILDVDTEFLTLNGLQMLYDFMEENPSIGVTGAKLLFPNNEIQHTCRKFPSVAVKLFNRFESIGFIRDSKSLKDHYMMDKDHDKIQKVDYVIGAFQFIRKDVVDKIGLYDEHIFYGPEDIDFCLRAQRAGYDTAYFPYVELYHFYQRITKKFFTKITWEHIKGLVYFYRKHKYITYPKI